MQIQTLSVTLTCLIGFMSTQINAYPWPLYLPAPREYPEDDYFYNPQTAQPSYYSALPRRESAEVYGKIPHHYYYDPYAAFMDEDPERQDERLAALPVGQETWYESETEPSWRSSDMDDVNAAFVENLILTQMARDAQHRRENARVAHERDLEDADVMALKALAGKPFYHVPKPGPVFDTPEYDDYPADNDFINWNGYKRSVTTAAPKAATTTTTRPREGQEEIMVPRPASNHQHKKTNKDSVYRKITQLLATESRTAQNGDKPRRLDKRFIAGESDLAAELRGLKHRILT